MSLQVPMGMAFGRIDGLILVGRKAEGGASEGEWIWMRFSSGECVEASDIDDPSRVKGRFDLMVPGDPDPERLMDLRIVGRANFTVEPGEELEAVKSGQIVFSGDEAFFIRFSPEILAIIGRVFAA